MSKTKVFESSRLLNSILDPNRRERTYRKLTSHERDKIAYLHSYVVGKLGGGWSPEQIAGRLRKEINEGVRPPEEYIKD